MAKKTIPIITHTEILSRAIRSIEEDIADWHQKCDGLPQAQKDAMVAAATEELRVKLDTLKTLYRIETGADYDDPC